MCLKSLIWHFTRSFYKYDVQKKVTSGLFKTCSMMIFLYHFNIFLSVFLHQMRAILCNNIVYLYIVCDVFLCKNLYGIALFLCVEMSKILR